MITKFPSEQNWRVSGKKHMQKWRLSISFNSFHIPVLFIRFIIRHTYVSMPCRERYIFTHRLRFSSRCLLASLDSRDASEIHLNRNKIKQTSDKHQQVKDCRYTMRTKRNTHIYIYNMDNVVLRVSAAVSWVNKWATKKNTTKKKMRLR